MSSRTVFEVEEELLKQIQKEKQDIDEFQPAIGEVLDYKSKLELPETLTILSFLYGKETLIEALQYLDKNAVSQTLAQPSNRSFHQVKEDEKIIFCLPELNFCECDFFTERVLTSKAYKCAHVIACNLSASFRRIKTRNVGDEDYASLII